MSTKKPPQKLSQAAAILKDDLVGMENQLAQLRRQMQEERAKREGIMAAGNGNSLWNNGGQGLLRTNFRSKSSTVKGLVQDPIGVMPQKKGPGEQDVVFINKERGSSAPRMTSQALPPPKEEPTARDTARETDRGLAVGGFDEADSHRSFLEALNEWRSAGAGAAGADKAKPATQAPAAAMEVQTEAHRSSSASSSAQPHTRGTWGSASKSSRTFFDKLALVSASKVAGQSASGLPSSSSPPLESSCTIQEDVVTAEVSPEEMERELMAKKMEILLKLERLEVRLAAEDEDDDDGGHAFTIEQGLVASMGLVKGDRLPDRLIVPSQQEE